IQCRRPELHLIIASATTEAKSMAEFFHTRKRQPQLEGEDHGPQTEPAILSIEEPMGDILVFLTGGKRKVVISTNIIETSLTLEGIVYVVDNGLSNQRFYNLIIDIENLVVAPISKASARQRAGRAGRLKALGIDNILGFDWPSSPSPEAMVRALEVLYSLGVLDDDAKLTTPVGFQVAELPLSIWISIKGQRELDEAKMRFAAAEPYVPYSIAALPSLFIQ
ncbi:probable pre-mRNA-splicing factor ATP-dependent RNA helicase DEAH9 isoform X2, partial [Tanacetum coccineum]